MTPDSAGQGEYGATVLRDQLRDAGLYMATFSSSAGAGKTTLMAATLRRLQSRFRVAALVDDLATEYDLERLAQSGIPLQRLARMDGTELDAAAILHALESWDTGPLDFLLLENGGDWSLSGMQDQGESLRIALLSVTEGVERPLHFPDLFQCADVVIVTKTDLSEMADFDWPSAHSNLQEVRPGMDVYQVSSKTGEGMDDYLEYLEARLNEFRAAQLA
jgi:hydrogenase nickel incorporation protein HypB